jgi:hypothetical protein
MVLLRGQSSLDPMSAAAAELTDLRQAQEGKAAMIMVMLGVLMLASGVIMFRTAMPGGRAHGTVIRSKLLGGLYTSAVMALTIIGAAMVIHGFIGLTS